MADVSPAGPPAVGAVVATALAEEQDAVLAVLDDVEVTRDSGRDLYTGRAGGLRVAVESLHGMGNPGAAVMAGSLLARWRAERILLVGIAGGFGAAGVRVGDVVVPDQVVGYEAGKLLPDGAQRRPEAYRPDFDLLAAARSVQPAEWAPPAAVHFGTVLSGEKVVADADVLAGFRRDWPKAVAVEMESFGVALAAYRFGGRFLMVKGVSDLADEAKDDRGRAGAAEAAARFAAAVLRRLTVAAPAQPDLVVRGPRMLQICWRLVDDWTKLALYFEIPPHDRATFAKGDEPARVWEWLAARGRLRELPAALVFIGRADLAEELLRG
ncbi:hypothetical protein [Dactylosporangium sp. CA-139066]|uniref:5'-methylthioadenosine/S-adenosylhomocysteine nucleosidase family protein n=1 Tax=Dactylosporangium sp. CA-139066 TaxID=3239930 RepID=UPI003D8D50B4